MARLANGQAAERCALGEVWRTDVAHRPTPALATELSFKLDYCGGQLRLEAVVGAGSAGLPIAATRRTWLRNSQQTDLDCIGTSPISTNRCRQRCSGVHAPGRWSPPCQANGPPAPDVRARFR